MAIEGKKERSYMLLVPFLIGISNILVGVLGLFLFEELFYKLLIGCIIIPGVLIVLFSLREYNDRRKEIHRIKHDERSERNRLKAADFAFRFLFVSLLILILLNSLTLINEVIFVALTGPIIAVGTIVYYLGYYLYEKRG